MTGIRGLIPLRRDAVRADILVAGVSFLVLFSGFRWNLWRIADPVFFELNQKDTEALVIGRMAISRQRGFLASAGLLGFVGTGPAVVTFEPTELWQSERFDFQTQAYLQGIPVRSFSPYFSHSGLQGAAFSALDAALSRAPPSFRLGFFHTLTSALVAAAYALLVLWLRRELGGAAALAALLAVAASPWLTAFARNLYWSLWLFLLPALGTAAALSGSSGANGRDRRLAAVGFATLLVRFLCGYEFATAAVAMAAAPVLYSSMRDRWPARVLLRRLGLLAGATLLALAASLAALTLQITAATGSARNALDHVRLALSRRTSGDPSRFPPIYTAALAAKTSDILRIYLADPFDRWEHPGWPAPLRWLFSRRYRDLIVGILAAGGWMAVRYPWLTGQRRSRLLALAAATLGILLGTLGWLVIFKAHSFLHAHVNPLMWSLLFLPLGGALVFGAVADAASLAYRALRTMRL